MNFPRVRINVSTMMIVVAFAAMAFVAIKREMARQEVEWWVRKGNVNPIQGQIAVKPGGGFHSDLVEGQDLEIEFTYDVKLTKPVAPPGLNYVVWGAVEFRDITTNTPCQGETFVLPLTTGKREQASGEFTYRAKAPPAGRYYLRHEVSFFNPLDEWRGHTGGSTLITVAPREASLDPSP